MQPLEALRAATGNAAKACRVESLTGTLKAGMEADLIAVNGRPDEEIRALRNIDMVVKSGSLVRSSLEDETRPHFSPLAFDRVPEGASFINW